MSGGPSAFAITASYKGQTDQRTFSLAVNEPVFHVSALVAGTSHTCAITDTKTVKCWGTGWLGNGAGPMSAYSPVAVVGVSDVVQLAAGPNHTCARTSGGQVYCWGLNNTGAVGDGTTTSRSSATLVSGLNGVVDISAAGLDSAIPGNGNTTTEYSCAVTASGATYCWGQNGMAGVSSTAPSQVAGLTTSKSVGAGEYHICVGVGNTSGQYGVKCWGYNVACQLGRCFSSSQAGPYSAINWVANLPATSPIVQVRSGLTQSCALLGSGQVYCWGDYYGNGTASQQKTATQVVSSATSVDVGRQISCATTSAGTAKCWGDNTFGQLGDGTITMRLAPTAVTAE